MKKILTLFMCFGAICAALSTGTNMKTFEDYYKINNQSSIGKNMCAICHMKKTGGALNPFGKDLQIASKGKKISTDILKSIEKLDSDKDGMSNIDEIKADRLPGSNN